MRKFYVIKTFIILIIIAILNLSCSNDNDEESVNIETIDNIQIEESRKKSFKYVFLRTFSTPYDTNISSPIIAIKINLTPSPDVYVPVPLAIMQDNKIVSTTTQFSLILNNLESLKNNSEYELIGLLDQNGERVVKLKTSFKVVDLPLEGSVISPGSTLQGRTWIGSQGNSNLFGKVNIYLGEELIASVDPNNEGFWSYQIKNGDLPQGNITLRFEAQLINNGDITESYDQEVKYLVSNQFPFAFTDYKQGVIETIKITGNNNDIIAGINQGNNFKLINYTAQNGNFSPSRFSEIASGINGIITDLSIDPFGNVIVAGSQFENQTLSLFLKKFSINSSTESASFSSNTSSILKNKPCSDPEIFIFGDQTLMSSCSSSGPTLLIFNKNGTLISETLIGDLNSSYSIQEMVMPSAETIIIGSQSTNGSIALSSISKVDTTDQRTVNISELNGSSIIKILVQEINDQIKYIIVARNNSTLELQVIRLNADFSKDSSFELTYNSEIINNINDPIDAGLTENGHFFVLFQNIKGNIAFFNMLGRIIKIGQSFEGTSNSIVLRKNSAIVAANAVGTKLRLVNYKTSTNLFTDTTINPNATPSRVSFSETQETYMLTGTAPNTSFNSLSSKLNNDNFNSELKAVTQPENGIYLANIILPNQELLIRSSSNYFNGNTTTYQTTAILQNSPPDSPEVELITF